jgi:hypothetical protein
MPEIVSELKHLRLRMTTHLECDFAFMSAKIKYFLLDLRKLQNYAVILNLLSQQARSAKSEYDLS